VLVGPGAEIADDARLEGPLVIGAGARIGSGAIVKESVLLPGAVVPEQAMVVGSIVGRRSVLAGG
jgi:mannose-1-phosphate guanylyltransferase